MPLPEVVEIKEVLLGHLDDLYQFYGEYSGCRIARKHIAWYTKGLHASNEFRQAMYAVESTAEQAEITRNYFDHLLQRGERLVYERDVMNDEVLV